MQPNEDDRLEKLIGRRLDDALSASEELELNRALIRSPEQRRMLDESERIAALAGEVLRERVRGSSGVLDFDAITGGQDHAAPAKRHWWMVPGVVAACVGLMFLGQLYGPTRSDDGLRVVEGRGPTSFSNARDAGGDGVSMLSDGVPVSAGALRRVSSNSVLDWRRDAGVFGIVGDDGNIYLIEVERTRTSRQPRSVSNPKMRLVRDDL